MPPLDQVRIDSNGEPLLGVLRFLVLKGLQRRVGPEGNHCKRSMLNAPVSNRFLRYLGGGVPADSIEDIMKGRLLRIFFQGSTTTFARNSGHLSLVE